MSEAPAIETARLVLRGHQREDFDDCYGMWTDPGVTRFIGGKPSSREEVWSRLLRYVGHWRLQGYGYWVAREKGTDRFVGEIGFADFKRDLTPAFGDTPEMGWALSPGVHGQGYATEAVSGALAWADEHFAGGRTVCMIDPANAPSLRVAEKVGFSEFARTVYREPTILFQRYRS